MRVLPIKPKYPIQKWLGRYEAHVLKLYGSNALCSVDRHLERFFGQFPEKKGLERFTIAEVSDYRVWRLQNKTPGVVELELLWAVRFWDWCIEQGAKIFNPFRHFYPAKAKSLNREDFRRLYEASELRLKEYLLHLIVKRKNYTPHFPTISRALRRATERADLRWIDSNDRLRRAMRYQGWKGLVEHDQLNDAFLKEAETARNAATDIKTATRNKGTAILNEDDYTSLIGGIY